MVSQKDIANNHWAESEQLRELLHQKGASYEIADTLLDYYEILRRLSDDHERPLLVNYGYENIADDMIDTQPIGEQWRKKEAILFNMKELATSRSRYHLLMRDYQNRQQSIE